jgi:cytoplasmic iron level regulating protein YaaA (DUF328/UPF0246 family)
VLLILSPSKSVNFVSEEIQVESGRPLFEKEAARLHAGLKDYTVDEILRKEKVSLKIARAAYENIQLFSLKNTSQKPAIFAFDGNAYDKLRVRDFDRKELNFLQNHLRIFSALYGILSPFDLIKPYRLDMGSKLIDGLYDFWREKVTAEISRLLSKDDRILVNLASNEYFKMIDVKKLPVGTRIILPVFQQEKDGRYVTNALFAKHARGLMTRFVTEHEISAPDYLKAFDAEGYYFNPHLSEKDEWYFTR